ncbi:MAG: enoyl-CoA hydratase/isomerase family protein [Candidatus Acidiferrales bacterium]
MGATQQSASLLVLEERSGPVLTLRLNRPEKLNPFNPELCGALVHALLRAGEDRSVRAVVIIGSGRGFCAGGDLDYIRDARSRKSVHELEELLKLGKELCLAIVSMPKIVIAAVNGPAAGGGMSLALACDLRIASEQASFKQAFGQIGLYPDFGTTFFLPRLVGLARATELFYTSEQLSAADACRIGIVCRVCSHDQFEGEAQELAQAVAAGPPLAFRDVKRTMIGQAHRELEEALDVENRLQVHCFLSDDCAEGLAAFFEKRAPNFRGH